MNEKSETTKLELVKQLLLKLNKDELLEVKHQLDLLVKPPKYEEKFENFKEFVLQKEKENKVVIFTFDGVYEFDLDTIIKQSTEGLLWDLNRDKVTILSWIDDKKWVNDYATMLVITKLKSLLSV